MSCKQVEKTTVSPILSGLPGQYLLQVGDIAFAGLSEGAKVDQRLFLTADHPIVPLVVCQGFLEALPFDQESLDIVFLAHALEPVVDLKKVLEEVNRVLVPEGYLVIMGSHDVNIDLSVLRIFLQTTEWTVHFGRLFCYPPFLERIGSYVCPFLSKRYLLLVQKKCIPLTPIRPSLKNWRILPNEG